MKITRNLFAMLALAASTSAFAADPGPMPVHPSKACFGAQASTDMAKMGPEASAAPSTRSWYLPTWEEASATTQAPMACDEAQCSMNAAQEENKDQTAKSTSSWYLPTWAEAGATTHSSMTCDETSCAMDAAKAGGKAPAEKTLDAWYLPA